MKTMTISADRTILTAFDRVIPCSCEIINERTNPVRTKVVYSENEDGTLGHPYMPRIFPMGLWNVTVVLAVDEAKDPNGYEYPFFIATDAWQWVDVWSVKQEHELMYDHISLVSGQGVAGGQMPLMVKDYGYGIHFSKSEWTLGCEKVLSLVDLMWLADEVRAALPGGLKLLVA
jgi:hypothetical protein